MIIRNKLYFTLIGGMMSLVVRSKTEDLVKCEVIDGGELKSRRHLNVRGKSATLPSITGNFRSFFFSIWLVHWTWICILFCGHKVCTNACLCHFFFSAEKDWEDIKFGVDNKVDYYAVSFVKDAKVVHELKDYLRSKILHLFPTTIHWFFSITIHMFTTSHQSPLLKKDYEVYCFLAGCGADIHVTVKIESADSIPNLHSIISASDGVSHVSSSRLIFSVLRALQFQ